MTISGYGNDGGKVGGDGGEGEKEKEEENRQKTV